MDSITLWTWSLVAGAVVVIIVAVLLLAIISTARKIDQHALDIWNAGKQIAASTVNIWMLTKTNEVAREILDTAVSIDSRLKALGQALGK